MAAFEEMFGPKLTGKDGEVDTSVVLKDKVVGIYFSAHWCGPCRGFTPVLAEAYLTMTTGGKNFEIVFASSDKDDASFARCVVRAKPLLGGDGLFLHTHTHHRVPSHKVPERAHLGVRKK